MGIKIEISCAPRLHHDTLAWRVKQKHPTRRAGFHVRVRIPDLEMHNLIVESRKYNITVDEIKVSFWL